MKSTLLKETPKASPNGTIHQLPKIQDTQELIADLDYLKNNLELLSKKGITSLQFTAHQGQSEYGHFVQSHNLSNAERLLLLLALAPHVAPEIYTDLLNEQNSWHFFDVQAPAQMLPSARTFIKLFGGESLAAKLEAQQYLSPEHFFYKQGVIQIGAVAPGAIPESGSLNIGSAYKDLFLFNHQGSPRFSDEFPAQLLETNLEWQDLILSDNLSTAIEEIYKGAEIKINPQDEPALARHERPGFRVLFHGPSGTGKTESVALIGKRLNRKVYRVNLSSVMSKYVGQTIKNLESLFNVSEHRGWILFFDEGDALFGKRATGAQSDDAGAQHSNRDVAFLLQRIEKFTGIIFVATNLSKNIDDAFSRRFEAAVNFGGFTPQLYEEFWRKNLPKKFTIDSNIDFKTLFTNYAFTPGSIINIIRRLWKRMSLRGETHIKYAELLLLMKDELQK